MGLNLSSQSTTRFRTYSSSSGAHSCNVEGLVDLERNDGGQSRTRSLGNFNTYGYSDALSISGTSGTSRGGTVSNSPESGSSSPEGSVFGRTLIPSFPVHLFALQRIKCPVCSILIPASQDAECHLLMCLTKQRLSYNEDVLSEDKGECIICLDELVRGDTIARLPCLCIYHKGCIEKWFEKSRSCPEHPID